MLLKDNFLFLSMAEELFFDLKHASKGFPSGKVMLFGRCLVNQEEETKVVYARTEIEFYRKVFGYGYQGRKLGKMVTPFSYDFTINPEDMVPIKTKPIVAETQLLNPHINSKTHDIFYVPGESHLISIYMEQAGQISGFELEEPAETFFAYYTTLLENKEDLEGDKEFVRLRTKMRRLEKKVRTTLHPEVWEEHYQVLSNTKQKVLMKLAGS